MGEVDKAKKTKTVSDASGGKSVSDQCSPLAGNLWVRSLRPRSGK